MAARHREDMNHDSTGDDGAVITKSTAQEGWARLDQQARECLGLSADAFLQAWLNGRIRMAVMQGPDYVPWRKRPIVVRESECVESDDEMSSGVELSADEFDEMYDKLVRTELGISGTEFIRKFKAGEYPDWDPELADLVMMMPFVTEQRD